MPVFLLTYDAGNCRVSHSPLQYHSDEYLEVTYDIRTLPLASLGGQHANVKIYERTIILQIWQFQRNECNLPWLTVRQAHMSLISDKNIHYIIFSKSHMTSKLVMFRKVRV